MRAVVSGGILWAIAWAAAADIAPDSHAPAGVMFDHLHSAGEWMVGYRAMVQRFDTLYNGSDSISRTDLAGAGFTVAPTSMTMVMHMLEVMYAPTQDWTVMLMPQYTTMEMSMQPLSGMGHGHHGGGALGGIHRHETSGLGDTVFAVLHRLTSTDRHQLIGTLGISAPTGNVHKKNPDGSFMHYGMQVGSGTWDLLPSLTYTGATGDLTWGAQLSAALRLEDSNDAGFAFGERYQLSTWTAHRITPWASLSLRLQYTKEGNINGHFDGPHGHASPSDFQANYGGEWTEAGIGVNGAFQRGALHGLRLSVEYLFPIREHYAGYQLGREASLNFSLSRAFSW